MKCEHYEGDGYTYNIGEEDIDLCEDCHEILFSQMLEQKYLEKELKNDNQYKEIMRKIENIK